MRHVVGLALLITVALVVADAADASRKPTARERTAVLQRLHQHHDACRGYPSGHCVEVVRISTADSTWAAVYLRPAARKYRHEVQTDVGSFHRRNGRWRTHQAGNGGGCNVPAAVSRDLGLDCY